VQATGSFDDEELTSVTISDVACGISAAGLLVCQDDTYDFGEPVIDVASGGLPGGFDRICVLLESGSIHCLEGPEALLDPDVTYTMISQSDLFVCGLREDGGIDCESGPGPEGEFVTVAIGHQIGCAITVDEALVCFDPIATTDEGAKVYENTPAGSFRAVAVEKHLHPHACAVTTSGGLVCFDPNKDYVTPYEGEEIFTDVAVGYGTLCALTTDGRIECFLEDPNQWTSIYEAENSPGGPLTEEPGYTGLTADGGSDRYCALNAEGLTVCWMVQTVLVP
jgi:hypothetical protein